MNASFRRLTGIALALLLFGTAPLLAQEKTRSLFDGKSLEGWSTQPGDEKWWQVGEEMILGGSLTENVPHNTFLATRERFHNFDLSLTIRLSGSGGLVNSGIQIRSVRVEGSSEMRGYQVDAGDGWWGKLYDESRRNRVIGEPVSAKALAQAVNSAGWNTYRIRAEGPRIRSWINGAPALDYTEVDGNIPLEGFIGIQVHSGGRVLVEIKDIQIEELAPTPGAMTWRSFEKAQAVAGQGKAPIQSAAEELAGFHVLDGFEVELVTADPLVNKVVDIAFDDAGRLWAITAVEYPIDGNESADVAAMYERGGRDQVLVIDEPWKREPHTPRVFADGLFIPMAILPRTDDVLIGMGPNILSLHDDDGDGRADRREVVLTGFGIQDSHLLPHRFVRAPGDWVYLAQGAFNSSEVRTKTGERVTFNKCKVGRFRTDGSAFEVVGIGLNNIWGFVIDRLGNKWIQEANDQGFPLAPFEHGRSYPGIGMERFHSYSPWHPSNTDFTMGGTGLSGLALSEDEKGFPAPWNETFFLANPIINAVQSIRATRSSESASEVKMKRVRDLLTSEDKNFRPVAIHFGPDGCLYIVDWYNPIISHNEVPRDHPDRDRTSSRIWRVRHRSQAYTQPVDVSSVADAELVALLSSRSTGTSRAAWHQIADRGAIELETGLLQLALDGRAKPQARVLALWSLQDLGLVQPGWLRSLAGDEHDALRREAARLAGVLELSPGELAELLDWAPVESDARVRLAAIESLASLKPTGPKVMQALLRFLRPLPGGPSQKLPQGGVMAWKGGESDIAFERSLVRAALEAAPDMLFHALDTEGMLQLSQADLRFALMSAGGVQGARRLANTLSAAQQMPSTEELQFLARHGDEAEVREAVGLWISLPGMRAAGLRMLADSAHHWEDGNLAATVTASLRDLLEQDPSSANAALLLRMARERRLGELEQDVIGLLSSGATSPAACLKALVELGCTDAKLYYNQASACLPGDPRLPIAIGGLAAIDSAAAFELLLELWPVLENSERKNATRVLLERRAGAERLLQAIDSDDMDIEVLDARVVARLSDHLGEDARLVRLRDRAAGHSVPVLRLDGAENDYVATDLTLEGAFTVEAWVRLDANIGNADGLLYSPGVFDLNFYDERLRLWLGPGRGDVIIAERKIEADTWTHVALTRAPDGTLALFTNGERVVTSHPQIAERFTNLDICRTGASGGCAGQVSELRIWSEERSAAQIGANFRRRIQRSKAGSTLVLLLPGDEAIFSGTARLEGILDAPPTLSDEEVLAEVTRFSRYRTLAGAAGDPSRGRELFLATCSACHQVAGQGTDIGPALDGVGSKGAEGLLRSILTPSAGVESGYRNLIVRTSQGEILTGFLAGEDKQSILLRRQDREDLRIPRSQIESARFEQLSVMPEGLLDALTDEQVIDLIEYLQGLL